MVESAAELTETLKLLKEKRKAGEIDPKDFYRELLAIMKDLSESLLDEVDSLEAADIRSQIPLLLVILDDQVRTFLERG